jgi:hypothetical protein
MFLRQPVISALAYGASTYPVWLTAAVSPLIALMPSTDSTTSTRPLLRLTIRTA